MDVVGMLKYKNGLYPTKWTLKNLILDEFHKIPYVGHPGYQKLITALRKEYYWPGMKKDATKYLTRCQECQQIKVKH